MLMVTLENLKHLRLFIFGLERIGEEMNERNENIFKRVMNGESVSNLAHEYDISRGRVYQIVKSQKDKQDINNYPLYQTIYKAVEELGYNTTTMTTKVFNRLRESDITTIEDLKKFDPNEWENLKFVGEAYIEIIKKIKGE